MARPKLRTKSPPKGQPDAQARRGAHGAALALAATPLLIGGVIALTVALSGAMSPLGAWLRSILGFAPASSRSRAMREKFAQYARGGQPFASLQNAIVGSAKSSIVAVLGPPRTALLGRESGTASIWRADTWYYPLDRAERTAIAIRFDGNVARDVEKLSVPAVMLD